MNDEKLIRGISRWDLTAIVINTVIGAGIFGLPSKVHAQIGSYSLVAFIVCALIIGFILLCFAEVASRFQTTGGMYLYAREAFGSIAGFEVGWLYWIVRITTFAANCNLLLGYLSFFYPSANQGATRIIIITLVLIVLTAVNILGVRESAIMTNVFTIGKLLPLLIFAAAGLFFIEPANFTFAPTPGYDSFSQAILLLIYAYVGFEAAVIPAGETRDPQRNIPFALISALVVCAVLFFLIQTVAIGTLPDLAKSERPLADAAGNFLGIYGAAFITVGALVSIFGNLNGGFLTASRLPFAMAERGELPQALSKTHSTFKTPVFSLVLTSVLMLILTVRSDFITALTVSTITRLIVYAVTCAALPVFRNRTDAPEAKFKVPFGTVAAALSLILIVWLLTNVDYKKEGLTVVILAAAGLIVYFVQRWINGRTKSE